MSRPIFRWAAIIQIGLVLFTGCHPTQPFFVARDESLANYISQSMEIEYADVHIDSLPEATQAQVPFGPDHIPDKFVDLTLEDCISMALQNSKILRIVSGVNRQSGSTTAAMISAAPGQLPSVYDPALVATTANTQPLTIDSQGNRVAQRGAIRSNQVGGVADALAEFDAQSSFIMGYNTTDRPRNVGSGNQFNPQFFQAVDANGQAAISKRMATGTIATARIGTVYSRNNIPFQDVGRSVPSDYTATLELQVTQPLLRGRGALINRIPIVLARINEDIQLHEYNANVRNLVKSVEDAYWDLYCSYRSFEASQVAHKSATDLWRVANARSKIGDTPPEAEAQSRALYARFRQQLHASLYGVSVPGSDPFGLYGREQILREKIGWSPTDGQLIRPADEPTVARLHFDWGDLRAEALHRSPELRRQQWAIKQRELELIKAKNEILPELNVTAFYRWLGVGDQFAAVDRNGIRFPNAGSRALEEFSTGDYQEVGARVELTPQAFGSRRAYANIQNSHIQLAKFREELLEKEMALVSEVTTAWRSLQATYQAISDFRDELLANEDEIRIYNEKINGNVGELNQLLDLLLRAEERRSRAQLTFFQAICEYNKAIVNVHYWKGSLLDLNNIQLEEGAWVDKAYWDAEERASERASGIYFDYGYTRPGVVSRGPVEAGGLTEGNISNSGYGYRQLDQEGEAVEGVEIEQSETPSADPGNQDRDLLPLPNRNETSASNSPNSLRDGSSDASVRQASAQQFAWGGLGLTEDNRSRQPAKSISNSRQSISDMPESGSAIGGRPVKVIRTNSSPTSRSTSWQPRY